LRLPLGRAEVLRRYVITEFEVAGATAAVKAARERIQLTTKPGQAIGQRQRFEP
jgi:hypothetical protein